MFSSFFQEIGVIPLIKILFLAEGFIEYLELLIFLGGTTANLLSERFERRRELLPELSCASLLTLDEAMLDSLSPPSLNGR